MISLLDLDIDLNLKTVNILYFAPFTQTAFIPKQDGYFMYVNTTNLKEVNNESETLRSTIVSFVEN